MRRLRPAKKRSADALVPADLDYADLVRVAAAANLALQKRRVFRERVSSGKFGDSSSKKQSKLEERIVDPLLFLDTRLAGTPRPFSAESLMILESTRGGSPQAAVFKSAVGGGSVTVRPSAPAPQRKPAASSRSGDIGADGAVVQPTLAVEGSFEFEITAKTSSTTVVFKCEVKNIVAACFGKRAGAGFYNNNGVVNVTLLLSADSGMFQVVSFVIAKDDSQKCRMLVNQRGGIGNVLLESKFVGREAASARTRVLVALLRDCSGRGATVELGRPGT